MTTIDLKIKYERYTDSPILRKHSIVVNAFTWELMIRKKSTIAMWTSVLVLFSLLYFHQCYQHFCFSQLGVPVSVNSHTNNNQSHISLSQYLTCTLVIEFYQRYIRSYTAYMPVGQYIWWFVNKVWGLAMRVRIQSIAQQTLLMNCKTKAIRYGCLDG